MRGNTDLVYCQNNGTIAVKPTPSGRLVSLIKKTMNGEDRVWVFKDASVHTDPLGNEVVDRVIRGVVCGSYKDGSRFLDLCRDSGLIVESGGFVVPFSNGTRVTADVGSHCSGQTREKYLYDWSQDEVVLMRWDLPAAEDLSDLLALVSK